jgi:hypothetical protein
MWRPVKVPAFYHCENCGWARPCHEAVPNPEMKREWRDPDIPF